LCILKSLQKLANYFFTAEVTDIEQDMRDLTGKGVKFVSEKPLAYVAGEINFGHPKSLHGVQIAFAQHKPGWESLLTGE